MAQTIRLVILYGGQSGEHEISLKSAASVISNLDPSRYTIIPIGMDKTGCCYINDYHELLKYKDSLPVQTDQSKPIPALIKSGQFIIDADVVFPVVHGPLYEDGCLQGLLHMANIAYVGCDTLSSAVGMDKDIARRLAKLSGIESAMYEVVPSNLPKNELEKRSSQLFDQFKKPLFVKPCNLGSSVGIHKVETLKELESAIIDAGRFDTEIIVEEYIKGREIELAVLGSDEAFKAPEVSAPGEISVSHRDGFYSYAAKYIDSAQTKLTIPANLSDSVAEQLKQQARTVFTALKCQGMARVDFFYNDELNRIIFNEINTIPGFTTISMYAKLWQHEGIEFSELLNRLIHLALTRFQSENQLITHYQ